MAHAPPGSYAPHAEAARRDTATAQEPANALPKDFTDEVPPPRSTPLFSHRLLEPLLKYLEGRGLLLSIEAKEALWQAAGLLIMAAVCCVALSVAWMLLAVSLVGVCTSYLEWHWLKAVAVTGGIHLLVAIIAGLAIWWRAVHGAWFEETIKELRKDRVWLKGH